MFKNKFCKKKIYKRMINLLPKSKITLPMSMKYQNTHKNCSNFKLFLRMKVTEKFNISKIN